MAASPASTSGTPRTSTRASSAGPSVEALAAKLQADDSNEGWRSKLTTAHELRDGVDSYNREAEYKSFIDVLLPAILKALDTTEVKFTNTSIQHRFRHALLETLHRLPHLEALRGLAPAMMESLLRVIRNDNEDNALLAMKICIELHRAFKGLFEVDGLLEVVKDVYRNMAEVVATTFGDDAGGDTTSPANAGTPGHPPNTPAVGSTPADPPASVGLLAGMHSFKLLQECPIAIVFLFQSYRGVVTNEIKVFVPLIFDFLALQPVAQTRAREEAQARGELFIGLAPPIAARRAHFSELLVAQVKTVSFLAYVIRVAHTTLTPHKNDIPDIALRMLMDIPPESAGTRKELLVATRHILATDFRTAFIPHLDMLLDERVLVGFGTTSIETLRPLAYSMIADLVHHVRNDLTTVQLSKVVHTYSCNVHDATLQYAIQTMCCKLLLNLSENIIAKERDAAETMLSRLLESYVRKVEGLAEVRKDLAKWSRPRDMTKERCAFPASEDNEFDYVELERSRPVTTFIGMDDSADASKSQNDARFLFRTTIVGIRSLLQHLKVKGMPMPDADLLGRLFRAGTRCMIIYETARREDARRGDSSLKEIMDIYSGIFIATDLLIFQEVFENNIAFYLDEMLENHELLQITQHLLSDQTVSQAFTGIIFRFLVSRLEDLGRMGKDYTTIVLRIFKMACMAVTIFPETNEAVLQPHLCTFIMHSLKLASQAKEPSSYYLLLRTLFRSIGGGRFEILYKEVLPLLQSLLETLNALINSAPADRGKRDLFIELCLTVPVRLSVLLPYLSYLMKPLVLSLQATPDLVAQGLRTLELCVDNLTHEFLQPVLAPFMHDVMVGLWKLLRPLPANHQHAHTTLRILGKLGGRNRRLLGPPKHEWRNVGEDASLLVHFDGNEQNIRITPLVELATRMLKRGDLHYRKNAYLCLKHVAVSFLRQPILSSGEPEEVLNQAVRGLFDASRSGDFAEEASAFITDFAHYVFALELSREVPEEGAGKQYFPLSSCLVEALVENLASVDGEFLERTAEQTTKIVNLLLTFQTAEGIRSDLPILILHQLANKTCSLCYEQSWYRKTGGAMGIKLLSSQVNLGDQQQAWMLKHEADFVRALLFMLKDMPRDPPANVDEVSDTLLHVLQVCNKRVDPQAMEVDGAKEGEKDEQQKKMEYLVGLLIIEVSSQIATVRDAAKKALKVLSDASGVTLTALLMPVRDRLLQPIFTKPLRALSFPMQVGFIDAVTFCINLNPPLIEFEDPVARQQAAQQAAMRAAAVAAQGGEGQQLPPQQVPLPDTPLSRLLTEAIGIADAEDQALTGRNIQHRQTALLVSLRVVCVKLLSAAMHSADFSNPGHYQMRTRILSVYFKLLYSRSKEVVDAVYSSLKGVLERQGKLPKELLQTGLRPVLMNLSDYKRLSVPSLTGLARLLELLTNYFKVEIGSKLLDHFRSLSADEAALTASALNPQAENGELAIMAAIVNIFRLLPHPAAAQFLESLVSQAVHVESRLKKAGPSAFTKPLAGFLNRYPVEACEFYCPRLAHDIDYHRSFCAILASDEAPALRGHLTQFSRNLLVPLFGPEADAPESEMEGAAPSRAALHAAEVIKILISREPSWIISNAHMIEPMIGRWVSRRRRERRLSETQQHLDQLTEDDAMLEVFLSFLRQAQHVDLLFHIVDIYTFRSPTDSYALLRFLFEDVVQKGSLEYKKAMLVRFVEIFGEQSVVEEHKTAIMRHIINPILTVAASRGKAEERIVDKDFINLAYARIWQHAANEKSDWSKTFIPGEAIRIEVMHMLTIIVRHWSTLVGERRKDIIRFSWQAITDNDTTVKHVAYVLTAYFLATYDSPPKICMMVYTGLLKSYHPEGKALAREALDILVPVMPARMLIKETEKSNQPVPDWLLHTRRLITEEGHSNITTSISLLAHIYQTIVRHPEEYFVRRDWFLPGIVNNLPKFSLAPQASSEQRTLAVDLIELIIKWERLRIAASRADDGKMEVDQATEDSKPTSPKRVRIDRAGSAAPSAQASASAVPSIPPLQQRDSVVSTLIRIIHTSQEPSSRDGTNVPSRALGLLRDLIGPEIWPDVLLKIGFFHSKLTSTDLRPPDMSQATAQPPAPGQPNPVEQARQVYELSVISFCNTVEALNIALQQRPDEWTSSNVNVIQQIVDKGLMSSEMRIHAALRPVLERVFSALPPLPTMEEETGADKPDLVKTFYEWASNTVEEGLRQPAEMNALHGTLTLLDAWTRNSNAPIDHHIPNLVRMLTRLTKDHTTATAPVPNDDITVRMLVVILELLRPRIISLIDQRRWLLSALVQIIEKSNNIELNRLVLNMTRRWVMDKVEAFPTIKEKAGILCKMIVFEGRPNGEELLRDFLGLIHEIYTDKSLARSELTVRLESAFLIGCKNRDSVIRGKFLEVFDEELSRELFTRMHYILGVQAWEQLSESNWIHQALDLLLGAIDLDDVLYQVPEGVIGVKAGFATELGNFRMRGFIDASRKLLYADATVTHTIWISVFSAAWSCLTRPQQADMTRFIQSLVSKEYHMKSLDKRPNNIQALLNGVAACSPMPSMPPHLVRYLGKTFNVWHTALEMLSETVDNYREDDQIRESTLDAMAEMYGDLSEDDLFYGLWRRRCYYAETNVAISFEQNGMWQQAEHMYEAAQSKARTGAMPFTESEYAVWEDHWIMCAQKLQQWDILTDLAKHEQNNELLLECSWRLCDWVSERDQIETAIKGLNPAPTPRRRVYEAYMALVRSRTSQQAQYAEEKKTFERILDDGMQLSLRKWFYLPDIVSDSHVPLLQLFQQFVELQEAGSIFQSLAITNITNLDQRSQELKNILMTWRERLPNLWDDINVWSDIVAWRQHVFSAINNAYMPLVNPGAAGAAAQQNANSYAYRGYHEAAWIINRFAHVARKHELSEVCLSSLTKIYTLPNIEIQEAFLKLREQAKSHFQNANELPQGLEVISNTNLSFFGPAQKAEFFTLKGMYLAKLGMHDEVSTTFNQALTMDMTYPKAWAEWGDYHDRQFRKNPDTEIASHAVNCYLQAAGLYKNSKVRKLLIRILWLLGLEDEKGTVSKAFDQYKGDVPVWYWITFIPQLLTSLASREQKYARVILMKIAKAYPQSLYFLLRTQKEELAAPRIAFQRAQAQKKEQAAAAEAAKTGETSEPGSATSTQMNGGPSPPKLPPPPQVLAAMAAAQAQQAPAMQQVIGPNGQIITIQAPKHAWDIVEEVISILKTAFPLLALSMETFCDQVISRFKQSSEEDIYRLVNALLYDAFVQYNSTATKLEDPGPPSQTTLANVNRVAEKLQQDAFFEDFVRSKPNLPVYIQRLQKWRDRYEKALDRKPRRMSLENSSHWLVEFQYHRFDEIEVPGQYLKMEDSNTNFVRIDHFQNKFDFHRSAGTCIRRLTFVGNDGTLHPFAIQLPAPRHARREERIAQFFRMLNDPLQRRKETRKRNLTFNIPITVPLAPTLRLIQNDASMIVFQDVWESHCRDVGIGKEDPVICFRERLHQIVVAQQDRVDILAAKLEAYEEVALKLCPDDVLKRFMHRSMATSSDLWHIRKQMTLQYGALIFMTNVLCMTNRTISRMGFSRGNGGMFTSDMLPSLASARPDFVNTEPVPFRFTPNLQKWFGVIGTEGVLTSAIMAIARSLTDHEHDLEHRLSIFVREEVVAWHQIFRHPLDESRTGALRDLSLHSIDEVVKRARLLSCKSEREKIPYGSVPANQTIIELLAQATNPTNLCAIEPMSLPWF